MSTTIFIKTKQLVKGLPLCLLTLLLLSACGSDDNNDDQKLPAPRLVSTTPANGATDVAGGNIEVTFTYDRDIVCAQADLNSITATGCTISHIRVSGSSLLMTAACDEKGGTVSISIPSGVVTNTQRVPASAVTLSFTVKSAVKPDPQPFNAETAADAVKNMGVGWNLGNTLDSNSGDVNNMWIEGGNRTTSDYETAWGQPVTKPELLQMMKQAGFNAIRVPVTWYPHMEATFSSVRWDNATQKMTPWDPVADPIGTKIQTEWMNRVHEVVDYVIDQGMYCILNVHHDTGSSNTAWLRADDATYAQQKDRFEAIWQQIAQEFKDYDEHLLFEGYNEMLDPYSSWCFASFATASGYSSSVATSAYNAINSYAQSFVDAVRATGGNNAQRNLIVCTYGACSGAGTWNSHLQDPLKNMQLPTDNAVDHLIFEVHSYPSIKNGLSNAKKEVDQMFSDIATHLASRAPVIVGEWGTANDVQDGKDDYDVRRADKLGFARYFVEQAKAKGFATFYWMGLSNGAHRSVPEFNQPDLKDAIIKGYYGD